MCSVSLYIISRYLEEASTPNIICVIPSNFTLFISSDNVVTTSGPVYIGSSAQAFFCASTPDFICPLVPETFMFIEPFSPFK